MMSLPHWDLSLSFLLFAAVTYAIVLGALLGRGPGAKSAGWSGALVRAGILLWITSLLFMARQGLLEGSSTRVSALFPVLVVALCVLLFLFFSKRVGSWAEGISPGRFVFLQVFRVGVEFFIFQLIQRGLMPESMTLGGWNNDVLVATSAPIVAGFLSWYEKKGPEEFASSRRAFFVFHIVGMAILSVTAVYGMLSAPSPLQMFHFDTPNVAVQQFPYVLIPGFFVPLGFALHILGVRATGFRVQFGDKKKGA
jgi:hypothetical protein